VPAAADNFEMHSLKACRATRDFVSGVTPLGIVRQGLNEELSNCIVARNGTLGPALARYGTPAPSNDSVGTRLRHGRGTNCDCGLQHQLGAIPLTQNAALGA
jgi:hypothetical protein